MSTGRTCPSESRLGLRRPRAHLTCPASAGDRVAGSGLSRRARSAHQARIRPESVPQKIPQPNLGRYAHDWRTMARVAGGRGVNGRKALARKSCDQMMDQNECRSLSRLLRASVQGKVEWHPVRKFELLVGSVLGAVLLCASNGAARFLGGCVARSNSGEGHMAVSVPCRARCFVQYTVRGHVQGCVCLISTPSATVGIANGRHGDPKTQ